VPVITKILEQKRRPNRRNIYLDGRFAFGCNLNVVARFRLRVAMNLTEQQVREIQQGEVRQEALDHALRLLQSRLHSRAELHRKLMRREYGEQIINGVLDDLARMDYINDDRFAKTKAQSAAKHKQHGKHRAMIELLKSGVNREVSRRAIEHVYESTDSMAIARELAATQLPRLKKLDPLKARRRLAGMLARRGFDYDDIRPVIDEVLGSTE
jgi:regulatory protein